ncbi:hypothetical protein A2880_02110 [Candidatus Peribacteria bacterium RIFCSPHIGHO2_01_FULL_49_38]|nr:MAG: hypothetical protein A2880_02110 [Candidatus Peribacteria bacterium RIFCSPHIGHO2_01_FULL_49_38]
MKTLRYAFAAAFAVALLIPMTDVALAQEKADAKKPADQLVQKLPTKAELPQYFQSISYTVHSRSGWYGAQGSSTAFTRGDTTLLWTAGHVIENLRSTREVLHKGSKKTVVEWQDAQVVREYNQDGRRVGQVEMDCEVLAYSDADHGEDLAILRVRAKNFGKDGVHFYLDDEIPGVSTRVIHVGSLLGQIGSNSVTDGVVSQTGRIFTWSNGKVYDQTSAPSFPGSSGGGIFLEDGRYIGMLVRGAGESFGLYVPVRRIRSWTKEVEMEWAMDPRVPMPPEKELKKLVQDNLGTGLSVDSRSDPHAKAAKSRVGYYLTGQPIPSSVSDDTLRSMGLYEAALKQGLRK